MQKVQTHRDKSFFSPIHGRGGLCSLEFCPTAFFLLWLLIFLFLLPVVPVLMLFSFLLCHSGGFLGCVTSSGQAELPLVTGDGSFPWNSGYKWFNLGFVGLISPN